MGGYDILMRRGVTRLCHFTKFQKLCDIIDSKQGILAANLISFDIKDVTDPNRFDGELGYISCSIQYPNSWYFNKVKDSDSDVLFKDWVIIFIEPTILLNRKSKFSPCNASKEYGAYINDNIDELESIFDSSISTWQYPRSEKMLSCCPTDGQAEIMINRDIPLSFIKGICVPDKDLAKRVFALLKTTKQSQIRIYISNDLFTNKWSKMVRAGSVPFELEYDGIN